MTDVRARDPRASMILPISSVPEVDVVIEIQRGTFLKRGPLAHRLHFTAAMPIQLWFRARRVRLERDLLDALVLGPRLSLGTWVRVKAWGAVTLTDRGMTDDKLICGNQPVSVAERQRILRFFHFYAKCKGLLNAWRRRPERNASEGWCDGCPCPHAGPTAGRFVEGITG